MPRLELSPLRQSDPPLQRKFRSIWLRVKDLPYDALHRYHRLGRKGKVRYVLRSDTHRANNLVFLGVNMVRHSLL